VQASESEKQANSLSRWGKAKAMQQQKEGMS
jgi:hypothetical protein